MFRKQNFDEVVQMFKSGKSVKQIAEKLNMHWQSIAYRLKSRGVKLSSVKKYSMNEQYFDIIDTEDKAYWLGFIASDGNVHSYCLHIGIHADDYLHLEKFKKSINATNPVKVQDTFSKGKPGKIARIDLYSKYVVNSLSKYGVIPNKTGKLDWSKFKNNIPKHLLIHFIRGYFDGDGCWKAKKCSFSIGEKGGQVITGILEYLKSQGLQTQTKIRQKNKLPTFYILEVGGTNNIRFIFEILYKDCTLCLERKYHKVKNYLFEII